MDHKDDGDGFCVGSDLPVAQCAGCMGHVEGVGVPVETFGETTAKYRGRVSCGDMVEVGDIIYVDAEGEWICGSCSRGV